MLSNYQFLDKILISFKEFIKCGSSCSTAKLKPLHGAIAQDIAERLGDEYKVWSQGYDEDKEIKIKGRYIDKNVDITIVNKQENLSQGLLSNLLCKTILKTQIIILRICLVRRQILELLIVLIFKYLLFWTNFRITRIMEQLKSGKSLRGTIYINIVNLQRIMLNILCIRLTRP